MSEAAFITSVTGGLCVICEEIPEAESTAFELWIPGGIICDPEKFPGVSLILAEMASRGAGSLDSKGLSDSFDRYGIRHSESAGHDRFVFRMLCLAGDEGRALSLLSLMVLAPTFPEEHLESIKDLLLFDIAALQDAPGERVSLALNHRHFPGPHGRCPYGSSDGITSVTPDVIRTEFERLWRPAGAVLSVSGAVSKDRILDSVEKEFRDWRGQAARVPATEVVRDGFYEHIQEKASHLYMACAFPSVRCTDPSYYTVRVLNEILSGGMYGRLFMELRERRGLCYGVGARYSASRDAGTFYTHASTGPDRGPELMEVLLEELIHAADNTSDEELVRARINLQTSLVLGEEGVSSCCSGNAGDWWLFGRIRSIAEIQSEIDKVSRESILEYVRNHPFSPMSLVSLGSRRLD